MCRNVDLQSYRKTGCILAWTSSPTTRLYVSQQGLFFEQHADGSFLLFVDCGSFQILQPVHWFIPTSSWWLIPMACRLLIIANPTACKRFILTSSSWLNPTAHSLSLLTAYSKSPPTTHFNSLPSAHFHSLLIAHSSSLPTAHSLSLLTSRSYNMSAVLFQSFKTAHYLNLLAAHSNKLPMAQSRSPRPSHD